MSVFEFRRQLIKTHVFIISPNNSGSTLMKNLLALSPNAWSLEREGQFSYGYQGPVSQKLIPSLDENELPEMIMEPLTWAASSESIERIQDKRLYDWKRNRKTWYLNANSSAPERASVLLEKTPSHLLVVDQLMAAFEDCRFIFMARNPYAAVEGIKRREGLRQYLNDPNANLVERGASHILNCLRIQNENRKNFAKNSCFISYEALCDTPHLAKQKLSELIPELAELDLSSNVKVKDYDLQKPTNMNDRQIASLSQKEIDIISSVFKNDTSLLASFGYELIH